MLHITMKLTLSQTKEKTSLEYKIRRIQRLITASVEVQALQNSKVHYGYSAEMQSYT
jgi:hypothetical protein